MPVHTHDFAETYKGFVGFGLSREADEHTVQYCLQKFSDDQLMQQLCPRMSDTELEEIFDLVSRMLKKHLTEEEYHQLYLKDQEGD